MNKISVVASLLLGTTLNLSATCSDLYISEYIEGGSYNKSIELYNPNETAIDLGEYSLELYSNGNLAPNATFELTGSLDSKNVFVLSHANAVEDILVHTDIQNSNIINFNGDDALVLKKNDIIIDSIGQIGVDPGSSWNVNGVSTKDSTLVRVETPICDDDASNTFDPSAQWISFPKDTFDYLGSHSTSDNNDTSDNNTTDEITLIHTIQGDAMNSPMVGQEVTVEAVVTSDYTQNGGFKGFYVQEEDADADENSATSEGIFIYSPTLSVTVEEGDKVKVTGRVKEYKNLTEISANNVEVLESGISLPTAVNLQLPASDLLKLESVEGMLVNLNAGETPLVVNNNYTLGRYGNFTVASERLIQYTQENNASISGYSTHQENLRLKSIVIDDGSSYQNPYTIKYPGDGLTYDNTLRAGYTIDNIVGVMDERYGSYVIQPQADTVLTFNAQSNPREGVEEKGRKELRIASFNVLNYFNTFENCTYGVDGAPAGCRGAESIEEFERQKAKIVNAMVEIDADIIGLMEIENDGYDSESAIADFVNALNAARCSDKSVRYGFVNVDAKLKTVNALGTDAIKVALIYNKKRVNTVGKPHALVLDENDKNRPSLIQVFKSKRTHKKFVVSVNHLKSKGSSCENIIYDGVNDVNQNDGQGNCNLTRTHASSLLTQYIATNKKLKKYKKTILLGDFNSYAQEDPIKVIENAGYSNVLNETHGKQEYTYVYKGEAGTLDYIFASKKLQKKIKSISVWHSNTDEPKVLDYNLNYKTPEQQQTLYDEGYFRASDHDQVIMDIKL